jgi:hypothetical protein
MPSFYALIYIFKVDFSSHVSTLPLVLFLLCCLKCDGHFCFANSILDQQQKQALPFIGGRSIGNFDGRIYVTSGTAVYSLTPVPWEKQVEVIL